MNWVWEKVWPTKAVTEDPLRELDPSLRQFLEKESPLRYNLPAGTPAPPISQTEPPTPISKPPVQQQKAEEAADTEKPKVPPQSLYPDGRYAHLWKTYRPLADIEAEVKTDQEKISDIIDAYKDRRAMIGQAAVENCSFEESAIDDCYRNGTYWQRVQNCHTPKQAFYKCYNMQTKLLKALGFLSTWDRDPETEEKIQMHADSLFHKMVEQERAIAEAKAKGEPLPTMPTVFDPAKEMAPAIPWPEDEPRPAAMTNQNTSTPQHQQKQEEEVDPYPHLPKMGAEMKAKMRPEKYKEWRESLKGMSPLEVEVEERAKLREAQDTTATFFQYQDAQEENRRRAHEGTARRDAFGEWLMRTFGPDPVEKKEDSSDGRPQKG